MLRLRMCDEDREKYGGPEWVDFDPAKLDDMSCDDLAEIEQTTSVLLYRAVDVPESVAALRLWLWLGLKQSGVEVQWRDFQPRVLKVHAKAGDAGPPESAPRSANRSGKSSQE